MMSTKGYDEYLSLNLVLHLLCSTDYDEYERSMLISQLSFEKTFGLSSVFIESTLMENGGVAESANPATLIKEAIHVISCGYEEKTAWGKEVLFLDEISTFIKECLFYIKYEP